MTDPVVDTAAALARALDAPGWLLLGVLLHLANQVARGRGWYALPRMAVPAAGGLAALAVTGVVIARLRRRRERAPGEPTGISGVLARLGRGCGALSPGAFARRVAPWQLLSRLCRLAALGCFLAA